MTTPETPGGDVPGPTVPHRLELTFDLPGTPEQVWAAIATSEGISAWMAPTTVEGREGGRFRAQLTDEVASEGTVTAWEPPRRFAYAEPGWAEMAGQPDAAVTPLASEFLIEATSGGTCVLRVVTSAFGTGADWEHEFWAEMSEAWAGTFDGLRTLLEAQVAGAR